MWVVISQATATGMEYLIQQVGTHRLHLLPCGHQWKTTERKEAEQLAAQLSVKYMQP